MEQKKPPSATDLGIDLAESLQDLMGDTGDVREQLGGFRIRIYHARAFPWSEVFKALLYRDFRVYVSRNKADIYIEASI
ncbi:MAG TPA: hypothetical protein VL992_21370 [Tepidisphaeraceae bacterium]|nr:hypothetical protein [Tepidisphaeraceae bacterium]HUB27990.1 hypothetical protein [Tepidisphaeraceae bacterium]